MRFDAPTPEEVIENDQMVEELKQQDANGISDFTNEDLCEMGVAEETVFHVGSVYETVSGNMVKIVSDEGGKSYPLIGVQLDYGNIVSTFKLNGASGSKPHRNDLKKPTKRLYVIVNSDGEAYGIKRNYKDSLEIAAQLGLFVEVYVEESEAAK